LPPQLHLPLTHCSFAPHEMLQPPQFRLETVVSTQVEPQHVWPAWQPGFAPHLQLPPWQVSLAPHATPHAPQLRTSVWVSEQPVVQHTLPALHTLPTQVQLPPVQPKPLGQLLPHIPQLAASVVTSRHWVPPQHWLGAVHDEPLQSQALPALQPAAPQQMELVLHPAPPLHWHLPAAQVSPVRQAVLQSPQ